MRSEESDPEKKMFRIILFIIVIIFTGIEPLHLLCPAMMDYYQETSNHSMCEVVSVCLSSITNGLPIRIIPLNYLSPE